MLIVLNKGDYNKLKYLKIITKNILRIVLASVVVVVGNVSLYFLWVLVIPRFF